MKRKGPFMWLNNAYYQIWGLTTNLKLLCFGKRLFLRYCGVSRYLKILIRKAAPLSYSSESLSSISTLDSSTKVLLLSITITCTTT